MLIFYQKNSILRRTPDFKYLFLLYFNISGNAYSIEITNCLASLGVFCPLLPVTYLGMLLPASAKIRSKSATPTTPKF